MKAETIAIGDIGASGGRVSALSRNATGYTLETVHEFSHPLHDMYFRDWENIPQRRMFWNPFSIYENLCEGIGKTVASGERRIVSLGMDSWGSDGVWVSPDGDPLFPACAYRCGRFDEARREVERLMPGRERFELTGVYPDFFLLINQFRWYARNKPEVMEAAATYLPLVSLYNYWFCGERAMEYTWSTTGHLASGVTGRYCDEIFRRLGLPLDKMPPIRRGGVLGTVHRELGERLGTGQFTIMLQPTHDTACAFAVAAPRANVPTLVISAGTWWCMGASLPSAVVTDAVYDNQFSNVGGVEGVVLNRVNVGAFPSQQLKRCWEREDGAPMSWTTFNTLAQKEHRPDMEFNIDDLRLGSPADMAAAVREVAGLRPEEATRGRLAALAYMGLARKTARIAEVVGGFLGRPVEEILVVGGGARNDLQNQWLADVSRRPVRTGPDNATTLGNALVQARDLGWFATLEEGREALRPLWNEKVFIPRTL